MPLVPSRLFDWLRFALEARHIELVDLDGEAIIPIDLDLDRTPPEPAGAAVEAPPPSPEGEGLTLPASPPERRPKPPRKDRDVADAGTDASDASDAGDAGALDASVASADAAADPHVGDAGPDGGRDEAPEAGVLASSDAGPDDGADAGDDAGPIAAMPRDRDAGDGDAAVATSTPDAGAIAAADAGRPPGGADAGAGRGVATLRDPLSAAGTPAKMATTDPNVQVLIASDRLRDHELGAAFGSLLVTIPEWRSFFDGTDIDPIRDLDHLLLSGPQFRDSRKVVAVMDYRVPEKKIRAAIDAIIARSEPKGGWLDDTPVPAARARADRGDRIFALVPAQRLLVVLPAEGDGLSRDARARLTQLAKHGRFSRSSKVGILLHMVTPANAFRGLPVEIPKTLKWLRLTLTPMANGEADVALEALDESAEAATRHAESISTVVETLRKPDLGLFGGLGSIELFAPVAFSADGPLIRAKVRLTKGQLRYVIVAASQEIAKQASRKAVRKGD